MPTFKQHVPGFIDIDPDSPTTYSSQAELLAIPFIARWAKPPHDGYCVSPRSYASPPDWFLMVTSNEGKDWWVLGWIDDPVGLPTWEKGKPACAAKQ